MRRVFSRPFYVLTASGIALLVFAASVWFPLSPTFVEIAGSIVPLEHKSDLIRELLLTSVYELSPLSLSYLLAVSVLVGLNATLMLFYIKMRRVAPSSATLAGGITGMVAAALGLGCAACGSVVLLSLFGTVAVGAFASLPFGGAEIGALGITLLMVSFYTTIRAINKPPVCPI